MGKGTRDTPVKRNRRTTAEDMEPKARRLSCGCVTMYRNSPPKVGDAVLCLRHNTAETILSLETAS